MYSRPKCSKLKQVVILVCWKCCPCDCSFSAICNSRKHQKSMWSEEADYSFYIKHLGIVLLQESLLYGKVSLKFIIFLFLFLLNLSDVTFIQISVPHLSEGWKYCAEFCHLHLTTHLLQTYPYHPKTEFLLCLSQNNVDHLPVKNDANQGHRFTK